MDDKLKDRREGEEERCGFDRRIADDRRKKQELLDAADQRVNADRRKAERRSGDGRRESERRERAPTPYKSYKSDKSDD